MSETDEKAVDDACAEGGPVAAAYERFDRWCRAWREAHPDDDRDTLELIDLYAEDNES